ncbi:MAG: hypothetical protein KKC84_04370, partial [Candidatus Omnitrophica bacterium]|nr:hypothetical protein [Candidatus Omnitrophota bacterium]
MWFKQMNVSKETFTLNGSVVSLQEESMSLIKKFIDSIKEEEAFLGDFSTLELTSVKSRTVGTLKVVDFVLSGSFKN